MKMGGGPAALESSGHVLHIVMSDPGEGPARHRAVGPWGVIGELVGGISLWPLGIQGWALRGLEVAWPAVAATCSLCQVTNLWTVRGEAEARATWGWTEAGPPCRRRRKPEPPAPLLGIVLGRLLLGRGVRAASVPQSFKVIGYSRPPPPPPASERCDWPLCSSC